MPTATAAPSVAAAPMAAAAMPVAAAVPSAATAMAVSCRGKIGREGDEHQRERRYENRHELLHLERPLETGPLGLIGDPLVDRPDPSPPIRAIRFGRLRSRLRKRSSWPVGLADNTRR
jgi:hypothetical protein